MLSGTANDGGLYVPQTVPVFTQEQINSFKDKSYEEIARVISSCFIGDAINHDELSKIINYTYRNEVFSNESKVPLVQIDDNMYIMELFHGPTIAFKDYALQLLGNVFDHVLEKLNKKITVVGATSGDTGSAAIHACKNRKNIEVFILHPQGRVSDIQRKQMTTVAAKNIHNLAVKGDFDDCQALVKRLFSDKDFVSRHNLTAINSINWARIAFQIIYYFVASAKLGSSEKKISFAVPTGNFGNVFAAYTAKKMGLPVNDLIIGTNKNDIITRFFETGEMVKTKAHATMSPSMDIQISSNFERYLFDLLGQDGNRVKHMMDKFSQDGSFSVDKETHIQARNDFSAYRCSEEETIETIRSCYNQSGYVIDPHTAVGLNAAIRHKNNFFGDDNTQFVALACAHPAKFPDTVHKAIGFEPQLPPSLRDLHDKQERFTIIENDYTAIKEYIS